MFHEPAKQEVWDGSTDFKMKLGLFMFFIYAIVYSGFVFLNIVFPSSMDILVFWGLNLAVVYGFGLILLAVVMGFIYNFFCSCKEDECKGRN